MPAGLEVEYFFLIPALLGQLTVVVAQRIFRVAIDRRFLLSWHGKKFRRCLKYPRNLRIAAGVGQQKKTMILTGFD